MAPAVLAGPVRTCVGCRGRESRSHLVRFVAVPLDGGFVLTWDPRRSMPGRGAWLHPDPDCYDLAERRRAFGRALRVAPLDLGDARAAVVRALRGGSADGTQAALDVH